MIANKSDGMVSIAIHALIQGPVGGKLLIVSANPKHNCTIQKGWKT